MSFYQNSRVFGRKVVYLPLRRLLVKHIIDMPAAADTEISASTDALVIAEKAATVSLDINIGASTDALLIAEQAASISLDIDISAATDALVIAEKAAAVALDVDISATTDALVIAEKEADVSLDIDIAATTDTLVIAEKAAIVTLGVNVAASTDTLVISEKAATITLDVNVQATTDALVLSTFQVTLPAVDDKRPDKEGGGKRRKRRKDEEYPEEGYLRYLYPDITYEKVAESIEEKAREVVKAAPIESAPVIVEAIREELEEYKDVDLSPLIARLDAIELTALMKLDARKFDDMLLKEDDLIVKLYMERRKKIILGYVVMQGH